MPPGGTLTKCLRLKIYTICWKAWTTLHSWSPFKIFQEGAENSNKDIQESGSRAIEEKADDFGNVRF